MEISAELVKELRERSGAGIMECKRALRESRGSLEGAINFLRQEGVVKAAKKSGRATAEGLIGVSFDGKKAALVELSCETDFVARTDPFQKFLSSLASLILNRCPSSLEQLLGEKENDRTVQEKLQALIAQLGENMAIRRFALSQAGSGERIGGYLHTGSKIGVLIKIRGVQVDDEACREIAMHVAAMHPTYLNRETVPLPVLQREREILQKSPELSGKPAEIQSRILDGKLGRFYSENCLVEQAFVKDPTGKKTVGSYLKEKDPAAVVLEMIRFQVGENA